MTAHLSSKGGLQIHSQLKRLHNNWLKAKDLILRLFGGKLDGRWVLK